MNQRWLMLGIASGLAGAILALTFFWGGLHAPATKPLVPAIAPGQPPPPLPSGPASLSANAHTPSAPGAGSAQGYILRSTTRHGIPVEITGQTLDPLPHGQWQVGRPLARIRPSEYQLIQIQAEDGTVLAPANQPRSGELRGHVTLFFFEGPPGRALNTSYGSSDLVLRLRLEDARFDLELGQIDSDGPVELDHVRFAFRGQGLSLTFNQLRQHIDHLEIFQGRSLRLKTEHAESAATPDEPLTRSLHTREQPVASRPPVYYQAQLFDAVQVTSPQADLTGEVLRMLFAMGREKTDTVSALPPSIPGPDPHDADDASSLKAHQAVIFKPEPRDLIVQWTGRLVVEPLAEKPAAMVGPDDVHVALTGSPVTIVTRQEDRITAALVEYQAAEDRVRLKGAPLPGSAPEVPGSPVVIDSVELGRLSLPELVLEPRQGRGVILGGGELRGDDRAAQGRPQTTGTDGQRMSLATSALPAGMSIAWSERLHLLFDAQKPAPDSDKAGTIGRLGPLRQAVFQGRVQVMEPRMQLQADELAVLLAAPLPAPQGQPAAQPGLENLKAAGNVRVRTFGPSADAPSPPTPSAAPASAPQTLTLASDRFEVAMDTTRPGRVQPGELRASGNVDAQTQNHRIQADRLVVELLPRGDEASETAAVHLPVRRLLAENHVRVTENALQAAIAADKVVIDAVREQLTAWGTEQNPTQLRLPDATLTSTRIDLDQSRRRLTSPGGVFVFLEREASHPQAQPAVITTAWTRDMSFDQATGQALFRGNVRTQSQARRDTMQLACEELAILFDPTVGTPVAEARQRDSRQVKTLAARGNVEFQSENRFDPPQSSPATRLTLQGPDLLFENARQAVQILGPGRMLFEDYRPPSADAAPATGQAVEPRLRFAGGRGATLFTWQGQFAFDTAGNDLTIVDTVRMIHRPADSPNIVTLDCSRFIADLEPTGGVSSWASGTAPRPDLRGVTALGPVNVTIGGHKPVQVRTGKLIYDGKTQSLLLQADPGQMTQVQEAGQPGLSAQAIRWDMPQERWEIIHPGAGRVPLGR